MKNGIIKLLGFAIVSFAVGYGVKNFAMCDDAKSIEPKHIEFSQNHLDISEIPTKNQPIWYVKGENSTICYKIIFRNEGGRNFQDYPGILHLISNMLFDGAGNYDSSALKEALIDNNIELNIDFSYDEAVVFVRTVADNFELSVDLLEDILTKAHFDSKKLEMRKQERLMELSQLRFVADFVAHEKLSQIMYPENHPYRINLNKSIERTSKYTKKDCEHCYSKIFAAKDALITFVGATPKDVVSKRFSKLLDHLTKSKHNDFEIPVQNTEFENYGKRVHVEVDTPQTHVCFAVPTAPKTSVDKFACRLANNVLGGSATIFVSRLFTEVRDKAGLTYGIYTGIPDEDLVAALYGNSTTRPENVDKLIDKVVDVIKEFAEKGITQQELDYHKTAIFSKNVLESTNKVAGFVTNCRMDGIAVDHVNDYLDNYKNLTLTDINRAIKSYFDCNKLVFVSAGKTINKGGK